VNEDFVKLLPNEVKTIHHRGGTCLGTARTNFDRDAIIKSLVKNGFNQVYVICGNSKRSRIKTIKLPSKHTFIQYYGAIIIHVFFNANL